MTKEEFENKWLCSMEISTDGVINYLDELFIEIQSIMQSKLEIKQIKYKYGKCRIYSNLPIIVNEVIEDFVDNNFKFKTNDVNNLLKS